MPEEPTRRGLDRSRLERFFGVRPEPSSPREPAGSPSAPTGPETSDRTPPPEGNALLDPKEPGRKDSGPEAPDPTGRPGPEKDDREDRLRAAIARIRAAYPRVALGTADEERFRPEDARAPGPREPVILRPAARRSPDGESRDAGPRPGPTGDGFAPTDLIGLPPGDWVDQGVYRTVATIRIGSIYGALPLEDPNRRAPLLAPWGGASPLLFLDLETTGLAGGTGTYAFLAGIARSDGERVRVEQYFLATPAREEAFLAAVGSALREGAGLATYNGRAYDAPLLRTRCTLTRSPYPLEGTPHLDLLPLARRRWRSVLESRSLSAVETHALGVRRTDDVPGRLIPPLYADFLRTGDARPLRGVFHHNRLDLLSLAALVARMAAWVAGEEGDPVLAGDLWAERGEEERAEALWRRAAGAEGEREAEADRPEGPPRLLGGEERPDLRSEAWRRLARAARRRGAPEEADRALGAAISALTAGGALGAGVSDLPVLLRVERAKIREHALRDLEGALRCAEEALAIREGEETGRLPRLPSPSPAPPFVPPNRSVTPQEDPLLHRIARLRRKLCAAGR